MILFFNIFFYTIQYSNSLFIHSFQPLSSGNSSDRFTKIKSGDHNFLAHSSFHDASLIIVLAFSLLQSWCDQTVGQETEERVYLKIDEKDL